MLANNLVRDQVDAGNPFFALVLGFSVPVLVAAILAIGIAWLATGRPARLPNSAARLDPAATVGSQQPEESHQ